MSFMVDMVRGKLTEPSHEHLMCSIWDWDELMALGKRFGWEPAGAVYAGDREQMSEEEQRSYRPDDWIDPRRVLADDAKCWGLALERASIAMEHGHLTPKPTATLLSDDMAPEQFFNANMRLSPPRLRQIADFLSRGEFLFAVDD